MVTSGTKSLSPERSARGDRQDAKDDLAPLRRTELPASTRNVGGFLFFGAYLVRTFGLGAPGDMTYAVLHSIVSAEDNAEGFV